MKKILLILFILGFATSSLAADKISINKFGGLVTRTNPLELNESESPDLSNFVLDEAGSLTKRGLFQRYNSISLGAITFTNLYKFYTSSDAGYMVLSGSNKLYKATGGALTDISVSTSTVLLDSPWSFESFTDGTNEVVFAANNNTPLKLWNGSAANFYELGGSPGTNCSLIKKHKSRLWGAGSKAYPYRLYYSSLSNGTQWTTSGGSMDLPSYEKIMALETLSDTLFILTRTSVYALLGDTPQEFTIQKTRSTVGTHAYKSVVTGNKLLYFLNKSGVYVFDGDESVNISETIQPTINAISNTYIGNAASLFDNQGKLWIAYTSTNGVFNDKILIYDTVLKQWYSLDGLNFNAFFKASGGTDKGEIFAACSNPVGYLWKAQADSGSEIITYSTLTQLESCTTWNSVGTNKIEQVLVGADDSYTKLLAHWNGLNGATTYTTEDSGSRTVTFVGGAALDTTQPRFGTSSLLLNGATYVTIPDSDDWFYDTGDLTIDFWFKPTGLAGDQFFVCQGTAGNDRTLFYMTGGGKLSLEAASLFSGGLTMASYITTNVAPLTVGTWSHIAFVRSGTNFYIFVDGVSQALTVNTAINSNALANFATNLYVGAYFNGIQGFVNGSIDEPRISKGIARWDTEFLKAVGEYRTINEGTITSLPIQINSAGQASLGAIKWQGITPSNSDIQFTTRTGLTADTVYYQGWERWVSSNVVTLNTVSDVTVWTNQSPAVFRAVYPEPTIARNVTLYEDWDTVSPASVQFNVSCNTVSTNHYSDCLIPKANIKNDKFIGYWLRSPATGNSVRLAIGEVSPTIVAYTTANTVNANTWEYHYWPLAGVPTASLDDIGYFRITYLGTMKGELYLGAVDAYDFLDNDETITSTPNDYIQFRGILGTNELINSPKLNLVASYVIQLSYSSSGGTSEGSLSSHWKSKPFTLPGGVNGMWQKIDCTLESSNPTTGHTVYCDYYLDDSRTSGTLSQAVNVTGRTVDIKFYLPTGSWGKDFQFQLRDENLNSQLKIRRADITVIPEGNS